MTDNRQSSQLEWTEANFAVLMATARRASKYLATLDGRSVTPDPAALALLPELGGALADEPTDPEGVIDLLDRIGSPATVASAGARYFGFVIGGSLPATLGANWLAGAWDQNAYAVAMSPVVAAIEEITLGWLVDLLGLPPGTGGAFVTGATMANFASLAAARHTVLQKVGWDVESRGLFGAPPITVLVGAEVHVTVLKALGLLGMGRDRVVRVAVDGQGRIDPKAMPSIAGPTILCLQAGNVNSGAFDPLAELCATARQAGAWVHVDGAIGLWVAASSRYRGLIQGVAEADSWATDGHKWLNVPYDSGIVFCREPENLRAAMSQSAAYLIQGDQREPGQYTPESSRRARAVEVWAALRSLGRTGLADLIDRCCRHAATFADGLRAAGFDVLNDVVSNQVLVSFGTDDQTRQVIDGIQREGTCWCGGTVWHGRAAMRISVSSWATSDDDVAISLAAMIRIATEVRGG